MDKKEIREELILFEKDVKFSIKNKRDKRSYILYWIEKKLETLTKK
jgi:hypothetical protein